MIVDITSKTDPSAITAVAASISHCSTSVYTDNNSNNKNNERRGQLARYTLYLGWNALGGRHQEKKCQREETLVVMKSSDATTVQAPKQRAFDKLVACIFM
jgi:hypothetical protein